MDISQASHRLRSLASDSTKRSKTAVLRDVFVDIETAIRAGVSQVAIVEELRTLGLEINQGAFRSALRRLRSQHPARRFDAPAAVALTDFSGFTERAAFVCTTSAGSTYDPEALCRLLRASGPQTERARAAAFE